MTEQVTIMLPALLASRSAVLIETVSARHTKLSGTRVALDFSATLSATPSAVDELLRLLIVDGGASQLVVVGATERISRYFNRAARLRHVVDRVEISSARGF